MIATRERLPNRRASESFCFQCSGLRYTATISRFADGRVGEIFVSNHRAGSHADIAARDCAIATSIALQFGAPLETLRCALLRDANGNPLSPVAVALDFIAGALP